MTHQYERPEAQDGNLRLHLNENTAGCSPNVARVLREPDATGRRRLPRLRRGHLRDRALLRHRRRQLVLTNGLDDGIMLAIAGEPARRAGRRSRSRRSSSSRRSTCTPRARTAARRADRRRAAGAGLLFPAAAGDRRRSGRGRASSSSPIRTTRPACRSRAARYRPSPRAAPQALVFLDEAYADFSGQTLIERRGVGPHSESRRRPDVRQGLRPGRTARRRGGRRRRRRWRRSAARCRLTAQRLRRRGAAGGARRPRVLRVVSRGSARRRRRCSTTRSREAGVRFWPSDGQLRARLLRRRRSRASSRAWPGAASTSATGRAIPAARDAPASRPAWSSTRAGCVAALEEVLCGAR